MKLPQITDEQIRMARLTRDVLAAILARYDWADYAAPKLPEAATEGEPSAKASALAARSEAARAAYQRQLDQQRAAAGVIEAAAKIASKIGPLLPALLALLTVVVAPMMLCGCDPLAAVDADVAMPVASPTLAPSASLGISPALATSQPVDQRTASPKRSGDRSANIDINASGSGWPVVAALGLVALIAAVTLWAMAARRGRVDRDNMLAIARSIRDIGPGSIRDSLLAGIDSGVPHRAALDYLLDRHKLRVSRRGHRIW